MQATDCRNCGTTIPDDDPRCPECGSFSHSARPAAFRFTTGETIDSRYEVIHRIPGGGMGELYKVRHVHLDDIRAIKLLRADQIGDETYRSRFLREARIAASITHPNVALLHDFATLPDKSFYMVEEFIDGTTLARSLRGGRRFSLDEIVEIARQVLQGLGAIHEKGIIHRDISPDNIMLAQTRPGAISVKIIDLGIARSIDSSEKHSLTSAGIFVGKPHYASPEQMQLVEDEGPIDHRTDLYSLGVVLYEIVSGKVPSESSTPFAYLLNQLSGEVPHVDRTMSEMVPPGLERFITTLLKVRREERYQSTTEALAALADIRVGERTVQDVAIPGRSEAYPVSAPSKKRKQTAEVPVEQLKKLVEQDRLDSIERPIGRSGEPATQIESFDDSQKITVVQSMPVTEARGEKRTGVEDANGRASPVEDDDEPVAFIPEIPLHTSASPAQGPQTAQPFAADNQPARPARRRQNPLVWFAAGIAFVATVSIGGYLFYLWLDSRFGENGGPAPVSVTTTTHATTTKPGLEEPIGTSSQISAESEEPPAAEVAPAVTATPPRARENPATRPTPEPIAAAPRPAPEATIPVVPPPSTSRDDEPTTSAAVTPTEPHTTPADDTTDSAPAVEPATAETPSTTTPADVPAVLPGSTDDVREGDLVAPGPGVVAPAVSRTVEPIYPPLSQNKGEEGVAMFSVLVGPDGSAEVVKLIVSTGFDPLDKSAEDAARQTRFTPATKNGVKVRMWKTLRFEFRKTRGF